MFNQAAYPLEYTPRRFVVSQEGTASRLFIIESDHNAYTEATKQARKQVMAEEMKEAAGEDEQELARDMAEDFLNENLPEAVFGAPKAGAGMWASCLRVMDPVSGETLQQVNFEQNEAAVSVALVKFGAYSEVTYLLVGVAKDLQLAPRQAAGGFVYTYRVCRPGVDQGQDSIVQVHKTTMDDVPYAMCPFQGKVLVGVGKLLRLYDLGKKKLLRKSENKVSF